MDATTSAPSVAQLRAEVVRRFGCAQKDVRVVRAPYRICPLGAHIDHQGGTVTAMTIDKAVYFAYAPATDAQVRLASTTFPGEVCFSLHDIPDRIAGDWGNLARGAARALRKNHALSRGMSGIVSGQFAEGGLSSSAAVGIAYLLAVEDVNGLIVPPEKNVDLDQEIENGYLGLRNGILDQAAILFSRRNQLTLIDCAQRRFSTIAPASNLPPFAVLLAFSGIKQSLVTTDYNHRVEECALAARSLLDAVGRPTEMPLLSRVTADEYAAHTQSLSGPPARRARHFFEEAQRVEHGLAAWRTGNLVEFGRLMTASGESSIVNYECGSPPLIDLYHNLISSPGVFGARFSGAGFRGCCVALVSPDAAQSVADRVQRQYATKYPQLAADADVVLCCSDDGARIL